MDLEKIIVQLRQYSGHIEQAAIHLDLALQVDVKQPRGRPRKIRTSGATDSEPGDNSQGVDPLGNSGS